MFFVLLKDTKYKIYEIRFFQPISYRIYYYISNKTRNIYLVHAFPKGKDRDNYNGVKIAEDRITSIIKMEENKC